MKKSTGYPVILLLCMIAPVMGQQRVDLAKALQDQKIDALNRTLSLYEKNAGAVEMNAAQGDGLGILKEIPFETGSIEIDLLGENNPGRSFIGIAFNVVNEETYEAIYFRPFNFVATAALNKSHMVQYICHPDYTWSRLREERTGEFENEIPDPPGPDGWFRAIIQVSEKSVVVYLKDRAQPVLEVERLTPGKSDKIALWVGNGSSGRFRNLILHKQQVISVQVYRSLHLLRRASVQRPPPSLSVSPGWIGQGFVVRQYPHPGGKVEALHHFPVQYSPRRQRPVRHKRE